jgi:histidinol dehydrogenase
MRVINASDINESNIGDIILRSYEQIENIKGDVEEILKNVRDNGDQAIIDYAKKFDQVQLNKEDLLVKTEELEEAYKEVNPELIDALKFALRNIIKFHEAQKREMWFLEVEKGVNAGQIYRPIEQIGLYIPGGRAAYPSTVLMAAGPAKVAGVKSMVMCSPPNRDKKINPAILIAASECGVKTIYKIGGAQAIAAMTFGTETVSKVYKIFGPGNKWVNAAKKLLSNIVAIDNPAGPSEILIIADDSTNFEYAIADLVSQVEHDPENIGIVVSTSEELINQIQENIDNYVRDSERANIISKALKERGLLIKVKDIEQSVAVSNLIAPEHLEILTRNPREILDKISNAGAIFLGENTPVPLGDYSAGTNHILPTGGTAKMYSGLNIFEFLKIIDVLECNEKGLKKLAESTGIIAKFESLDAHKKAVELRLKKKEK